MDHGGLVLGISEWRMDHVDTEEKGSEWCLEEEGKVVNISYPNPLPWQMKSLTHSATSS